MDGYMAKPIKANELHAAIDGLLKDARGGEQRLPPVTPMAPSRSTCRS
jgi:DNA-binding response OmpR family regulator